MRRTIACTIAVLALAVTPPIALAQSVMKEGEKVLLEGAKSSITPAAPGTAASGVPGAAGAAGSVPGAQVPGAKGATTLIPGAKDVTSKIPGAAATPSAIPGAATAPGPAATAASTAEWTCTLRDCART